MKVDNAIIMAAGTASRFAPLSYEKPKALIEVHGEVLIERQIRQLREAGINEIVIVTGYKAEQFEYLKDKYGVILVHNPDYLTRNNNASIYVAREYLKNSYICSSDNFFLSNPFEPNVDESYYSAVYMEGETVIFKEAEKVQAVDTTAAGDTFTGYFIASMLRGMEPAEGLALATKAAAVTVTRKGAADSIPRIDELEI